MDGIADSLPATPRRDLERIRKEVSVATDPREVKTDGLLPAYRRFDGNMYRHIDPEAWERRVAGVEIVIVSGLFGLLASRDTIPAYTHSMAEAMAPLGKLNRWWHDRGLPGILGALLNAVRPEAVVDLLSLEYREAVKGYDAGLTGIPVKTIDFPGAGRGSQPLRGEKIEQLLRTGGL